MQRMFTFDPKRYAAEFVSWEYVRIPNGLAADYLASLRRQRIAAPRTSGIAKVVGIVNTV
jgi:hypothetical protein